MVGENSWVPGEGIIWCCAKAGPVVPALDCSVVLAQKGPRSPQGPLSSEPEAGICRGGQGSCLLILFRAVLSTWWINPWSLCHFTPG